MQVLIVSIKENIMGDKVEEFVHKQLELLNVEREAEIERSM